MNKSANMYGLLKAAAGADGPIYGPPGAPAAPVPIDAEGNGTGNPWNENYANKNDWSNYIEESMKKNMEATGYNLGQVATPPGKGTASQGGYKPGFGRAVMRSVRDAIRTSNATVPAKLEALKDMNTAFIHSTSNFAYNPYGMDKLQVEGTGKTLGEVSQGWKPAKPRTFDANHNPTFGAPPLVQAPKVKSAAATGIQPQPINYYNTAKAHYRPIPGVPVDTAEALYQEREKRLTPWRKLAVGAADTAMGALPGIGKVYRGLRFAQDSNIAGRNAGNTAKDFADAMSPDAYKHFRDRVVKRPSLYEQSFNPDNAFAR